MPEIKLIVVPAVKIEEGDRVLVSLGAGHAWDDSQIQDVRDKLHERFPDVEFTFLGNVEQIAVLSERDAEHLNRVVEMPDQPSGLGSADVTDLPDPGRVEKRGMI